MGASHPSRLLNLTGNAVVFRRQSVPPTTVRPDGELKLVKTKGPAFIHHHVHYYDPIANDEATIQVLETNDLVRLDEKSRAYRDAIELLAGDSVIVRPDVAQYLSHHPGIIRADVFTVGEDPSFTIFDEHGNVIGYSSMKWYP